MLNINEQILSALENSKNKLSDEAVDLIKEFIKSQINKDGGFSDRTGNPDPYYSVFGLSLAYLFEIPIDIKKQKEYFVHTAEKNKPDFVHAVSILRCLLILSAIEIRESQKIVFKGIEKINFLKKHFVKKFTENFKNDFADLFLIVDKHKSADGGYNHFSENEEKATTYANFLALGLLTDISPMDIPFDELYKSIEKLEKSDGAFVNEISSDKGITSSTAAGIIIKHLAGKDIYKNLSWIKNRQSSYGGFTAAENISMPDLLSTATALTALKIAGENPVYPASDCENFLISHWSDFGGFFGSLADMKSDIEYTYYGLLALGLS